MTGPRRTFGDLTAPGRASFDLAVLFAAVALVLPMCGVAGLVLAELSRRKGYPRWKSAMVAVVWCIFLGIIVRGALRLEVFP